MRLRSQLILLVALAVIPVVLFSVILAAAFAGERERAIEQATRNTAVSLTIAVRREVDDMISSLEALAQSPALEARDLGAFRGQSERIREQHPGWQNIALADASGRVLLSTAADLDRDVSLSDRGYFQTAIRERRATVSDLLVDRVTTQRAISVAVPAFRSAELQAVLVATFDPAALVRPLESYGLAAAQAFRVFDSQRTTIVRFPVDRAVIGTPAGPMFAEMATGGNQDWVRFVARTGTALYAANVPLPEFGWIASLTVPADEIESASRRSLASILFGGLGLLGLGVVAAVLLGRRIEGPMSTLARQAEAMGRAEHIEFSAARVREIDDVGSALVAASRLLRQRADERERYEGELAARAAELTEANRVKDEFLATVSHELRSPLNAIVGWTRMLKLGVPTDDGARARALETIERNAHLQEQLISDLLDVSRIVSGRLRIEARPVDIVPIVHEALDVVRPAADMKGVTLDTAFDLGGQAVLGDPDRLQQVLWNLLSNAVKFTPRGGRVTLRAANVNSHLEIAVTDNGEGISSEFLPHVFERFRQADGSLNRMHGGLGLGLSIVRHIMELHGGTVRAESDGPGRGATFTIELPALAGTPAEGQDLVRGFPGAATAETLRGVRVLVVEDEPDSLALIAAVLAQAGASRTVQVRSAADAWDALAREAFDAIVCDISIPVEDGHSLLRRVRASADGRVSRTPAVALTAQTRPEDRTRAMLAGFQVHVPKPVEPAELVAVVAMLTGRGEYLRAHG